MALTVSFWIGTAVLSVLLTTGFAILPKYVKPFRLLLLLTLWVGAGAYALRFLAIGTEQIRHRVVATNGLSYLAIERGGFGGTWTDVVERHSIAKVFFRERPLAQFQRESVVKLSLVAGLGLVANLDEPGKGTREQVIRRPEEP